MATQVDVCNWALARIAVTRTISALDETSQEASTCSLWLDQIIDLVLRDHPWPFARRDVVLALVEEQPTPEWLFSYRMPADCLRVRRIIDGKRPNLPTYPMQIAGDDAGSLIYCDAEDAALSYTARVTDASRWPPDFADALAWRLAAEIAGPLAQSAAIADRAMRGYYAAVSKALSTALSEEQPDQPAEAEWIRERA